MKFIKIIQGKPHNGQHVIMLYFTWWSRRQAHTMASMQGSSSSNILLTVIIIIKGRPHYGQHAWLIILKHIIIRVITITLISKAGRKWPTCMDHHSHKYYKLLIVITITLISEAGHTMANMHGSSFSWNIIINCHHNPQRQATQWPNHGSPSSWTFKKVCKMSLPMLHPFPHAEHSPSLLWHPWFVYLHAC